jgi:cytochrome b6-f complex iron-sulfur subunit
MTSPAQGRPVVPAADGRVSRCLDRREFVGACACALASLVAGGCASLVTRTVTPVDGRIELALAHYPELLDESGSLKVLPEGHTEPIYVLSLGGGAYSVLSPICTHLGCTVEIEGERLVCPCHGSTYDRAGAVLRGPAQDPLARYRAQLSRDGVLRIDLRGRA